MFYPPPGPMKHPEGRFMAFGTQEGVFHNHPFPCPGMNVVPDARVWRAKPRLTSIIKLDKDGFEISLDMQHFAPEEIVVKIVDGCVVIDAKHEEKRDDHGFVTRHISRRYVLPDSCNSDGVSSKLSADKILTVTAPKRLELVRGERIVPIATSALPMMEHNH